MTTVEPRLARRRDAVRESEARHRMRRTVWLLVGVALVGAVVWLLQAPFVRVQHISIQGAGRSAVVPILRELNVVEGRPIILIRPGRIEEALATDPWVRAASAIVRYPDTVEVVVNERRPAAWLQTSEGWTLLAGDGVAVLRAPQRGSAAPTIELIAEPGQLGRRHPDPEVRAAAIFAGGLPSRLARQARIWRARGELWATVAGYDVRLGSPVDPSEKAAALVAVLDTEPDPGSVITVIAPTRPAISPPGTYDNPEPSVDP